MYTIFMNSEKRKKTFEPHVLMLKFTDGNYHIF